MKKIRSKDASYYAGRVALYACLAGFTALVLVPFAWTVSTSLKPYSDVLRYPHELIPRTFHWENYRDVFSRVPFALYFLNTVKVTLLSCAGTLATSSLAAYAFARLRFPGRDVIFLSYLATLMIPRQIILIPNFIIMRTLGLLDNLFSLILTGIFTAYGTFLMRQFFLTIPRELEEAAVIDGYGYAYRFWKIIIPLAKPALATLAIITLLASWNDYLYPLVFINSDSMRTLTLGLSILRGELDVQWNLVMAATTLSILPLVAAFLAAQRFFVEGIALSGLKA